MRNIRISIAALVTAALVTTIGTAEAQSYQQRQQQYQQYLSERKEALEQMQQQRQQYLQQQQTMIEQQNEYLRQQNEQIEHQNTQRRTYAECMNQSWFYSPYATPAADEPRHDYCVRAALAI
jgi:hypothetical protein